jgi:predicted  nucleic acid-binding Zn-ribbon protein
MSKTKTGAKEEINLADVSTEERLIALAKLQMIDSRIDEIRNVRGELPLEVQDLEDEIHGLQTRIDNLQAEIDEINAKISEKKVAMENGLALIKKYEDQRMNVRNNREYDSLTKEIEYQGLEIQLAEKRIKEDRYNIEVKEEAIKQAESVLAERKIDLENKKKELEEIIAETGRDEDELLKQSEENEKYIEPRLLSAYKRIRSNARNGLAVVPVERDACGGCFNKIPPQRQLDIRMHKKIIVCEYCGRILVDESILESAAGK